MSKVEFMHYMVDETLIDSDFLRPPFCIFLFLCAHTRVNLLKLCHICYTQRVNNQNKA